MGLTPHEEREIHQIEESLIDSDPGFASRMSGLMRPRRELVAVALCFLIVAVGFGLSVSRSSAVSVAFAAVAAFLAGWCLGRVRHLDPRVMLRLLRRGSTRLARLASRVVLRRGRTE